MVELRTVKQVREFLGNFSDDCEVKVNIDGLPREISEYGWDSPDSNDSVEVSMKKAAELDLYVQPNHETE